MEYLGGQEVRDVVRGDERGDFGVAQEELSSRYQVESVRVNSGGTLNGILLRQGLVDEISLLIDSSLVGGNSPRSLFFAPDFVSPEEVIDVRPAHVQELRDGTGWVRYEMVR